MPPMDHDTPIKAYPFNGATEENSYNLFPYEMEKDEHVFFHGTAEAHLQTIIDNGFRFAGKLKSVSFAKNSGLSLKYACDARKDTSLNGCVLAVRFNCLNKPGIVVEHSMLHLYRLDQQPIIVGYCIVPAAYVFQ